MDLYEKVMEMARRRGFLWPSFEIYGGVSGFITYGPLGAVLKRKIEDKWREWFVHKQDFVEIETPIIMPEIVFKASGHLEHFTDAITECLKCRRKFRADHLIEDAIGETVEGLSTEELTKIIMEKNIKCPECGGDLDQVKEFNLMFQTTIGPYSDNIGFARPEAAQGMFVEFKRVYIAERERLPLGIAQIGKVLRNEISPRKGPIRLREFTIMEVEVFIDPENINSCPYFDEVKDEELRLLTADMRMKNEKEPIEVTAEEAVKKGLILTEWQAYFMVISKFFLLDLGIPWKKQRFKEQLPWEKAHYSKQTYDHEVLLQRFGWVEVAGHAYRTDYDLSRHIQHSKEDLYAFKEFPEPKIVEKTVVKPLKHVIGKEFRKDAAKVIEAISKTPPEEIIKAFETKGYFEVDGIKVEPRHVSIEKVKEKISGKKFIPHVVEPSFGADRLVYATLEHAYTEKDGRVVLRLPIDLAPIQVAVFPLVSKDGLPEVAKRVYRMLKDEGFTAIYDETGSIGRRYARVDEIGVPIAVTVDYMTLEDNTVTLRNRDTWSQVRTRINDLPELLHKYFRKKIKFENLGIPYTPTEEGGG